MAEQDQQFVEMVVKEIVDNPSDVKVERTVDDRGVLLTLAINPADMGKVIGKEGKTAEALRTLLRIIGAKNNARVNLKILEPEGSENRHRSPDHERSETPVAPTPAPSEEPEVEPAKAKEKPKAKDKEPEVVTNPVPEDTQPIEEENATEIL